MDVYRAIYKRRTVRLFRKESIPQESLKRMVDAARMAPFARNIQPLEYLIVDKPSLCGSIFPYVYFGGETKGLLQDKNRPVAYALFLVNTLIKKEKYEHNVGLAVENFVLAGMAEGVASCIMGKIDREKITELLSIPSFYYLDLLVALGYPAESPQAVEAKKDHYWRDEKGVLHVPKKSLEDVLRWNEFKN